MKSQEISLLGRALLGVLFENPSSGYDIRRFFVSSPMGSFSDSPGAIYPALNRLERQGFIRGQLQEKSGRRKKIFYITATGTHAFKEWLSQPVTHSEVVRGVDGLMLRFSFMELALGEHATVKFLRNFEQGLQAYIPTLREYLNSHHAEMPRSGALALDSGIRGYETLLQWTKDAITSYETKVKRR
jgi:DNA-binding PadR family transcriptional regulator